MSNYLTCTIFVLATVTCAAAVPVYTAENPPATPSLSDLPLQRSVTQHGITWTFRNEARVGEFVNGDSYVVGQTVEVVSISPAPANDRNGSVLNIPPDNQRSGFDGRVGGGRYDATLRAPLPVTLRPGDSLISTISVAEGAVGDLGRVLRPEDSTSSPVKSAAVLTCLANPVAPDAFRPSYGERNAPIYYSRNLRRRLLPRLDRVAATPAFSEFEGYFRRPWIDVLQYSFDAPIEYMPDYGREVTRVVAMASLLLMIDATAEQKEPLLVYFVQYGIDLFGCVRAGHPGWPAHGGHGNGRKWPIVFAGMMLGTTAMAQVSRNYPAVKFSEDMQTMYDNGWTGATVVYAGHMGAAGHPSHPGWGRYEHLQPQNWPDIPDLIGETYRRCCTSVAWVGVALAGRLMSAESSWEHNAFFDYADRWMNEDDAEHVRTIENETGRDFSASWNRQGQAWDSFVEQMWAAHRSHQGPQRPEPPHNLRVVK